MRVSYTRVRDEIFRPYVIPLLKEPSILGDLLTKRAAIIEAEWTEEIQAHNDSIHRRNALEAKQANDYRGYLAQMRLIPHERQSRTEQAWIEYAEKKLS